MSHRLEFIKQQLKGYGKITDTVRLHLPRKGWMCTTTKLEEKIALDDLHPCLKALPNTAVMELRNTQARNAFSGKMMVELSNAISLLEAERDLTSVIVKGANKWFCAGADIRVAKQSLLTKEGGDWMSSIMTDSLNRLRNLPIISVALIEGAAIGGGAEFAVSCDHRIINDDAYIRFVHGHMGLIPGWGGALRLVNTIGRHKAINVLATAMLCHSKECLELDLVDEISPTGTDIETTCKGFIDKMITNPEVLQAMKTVVAAGENMLLMDAEKVEHETFLGLWGGPANLAALDRTKQK